MSENQNTMNALEITSTPNKVSRAPMLIEIPVNQQSSPTNASKAAKRLSAYPSPRKEHTIEDIHERLQTAEQRREKMMAAKTENKDKLVERVQKNQEENEKSRQEAAAVQASKLATAETNRENVMNARAKKAGEHFSNAKDVCSSIKKAEQAEYKTKLNAIEASQKKAAEKRDIIIEEKKQAAASHVEKVHDKLAQKGKEDREKKAALNQKLKDAEARRNIHEVNKIMSRTPSKNKAKVVIEVDVTSGDLTAKCNIKAKERLEAQAASDKTISLENVQEKLKGAEERREQHMQQRLSSPQHKKNFAAFQQNREKLETEKKEADEMKAKRVAEAEVKAKAKLEEKAKKAGEHFSRAKKVMTSQQELTAEATKNKLVNIESKQQAAEARRNSELAHKKENAKVANDKVGEIAKVNTERISTKKAAIDQKIKDANVRRVTMETYKSTNSPAKLRTNGATSPKRAANPPAPPLFE